MPGEVRVAAARAVLAASLILSWHILEVIAAAAIGAGLTSSPLARVLASDWTSWAFSGVAVWAAVRPSWRSAGAVALLFAAGNEIARRADAAHVEHCVVMPGVVAIVFALGLLILRDEDARTAEAGAWELCLCAMGAMYFMSGVAKLRNSGIGWSNGRRLLVCAAAYAENSEGFVRQARLVLGSSPALARALASATIVVELGSALFLVPRWRRWAAGAMFGLHMGIVLFMGIEWEFYPLLLPLLVLPFPGALGRRLGAPL